MEPIPRLINLLPPTSLFKANLSPGGFLVAFFLSIVEISVVFHLALRILGRKTSFRAGLAPGIVQGCVAFCARQLVPIPFHLLIVIPAFVFAVYRTARTSFAKAAVATLFAESIVIIGSIFVLEPIMVFMVKERVKAFLGTALGFSIGTILEGLIPGVVLAVLVKTDLSLMKVARPSQKRKEQ